MSKKIKIAFDLDGVIIDKPPFIPKKLLEWLFKGTKKDGLHYRFPATKFEQWIRKLSHFWLFRPPIKKNIEFIKKLAKNPKYELYIVSGRYSFLEKETEIWLTKRGLGKILKKVYINVTDNQPHLFKEKILKSLKPQIFVDDDSFLTDYLVEKIPNQKIFYFSLGKNLCKKTPQVSTLEEIFK